MKTVGQYKNMIIGLKNNQLYHKTKEQEKWTIIIPWIPANQDNESLVYHYILFREIIDINLSNKLI